MEISSRTSDGVQIVELSGDLDGKTAPQAQDRILNLASAFSMLLLDMRNVGYVSSAGLRMLLVLYRQLSTSHGRLALVGLSDRVKDTMETTGFLSHFATFDQIDQGLQSLRTRI